MEAVIVPVLELAGLTLPGLRWLAGTDEPSNGLKGREGFVALYRVVSGTCRLPDPLLSKIVVTPDSPKV